MGRPGENIHKRKDGRWEARVIISAPVNGRTQYRSLYARSYQEVREKKKAFIQMQDALRACSGTMAANPAGLCTMAAAPAGLCTMAAAPAGLCTMAADPTGLCVPVAGASDTAASYIGDSAFGFLNHVRPLPASSTPSAPALSVSSANPSCEPSAQMTSFSDVTREWLAYKKLSLKESSYAFYSVMIDKHLLPAFGKLDIREISSGQINAFLADQKKCGRVRDGGPLADKTLSEIKSILNRILRYAKSRHMISEVPESAPVPVKKNKISVFTEQEMICIENQAKEEDTPFSAGLLLAAYTGIRIGELCALTWGDFDWSSGTFTISKTVSRVNDVDGESGARTHLVIGTPKTECSNRTIPIPQSVLAYFKAHASDPSHYVLTRSKKFMEPRVCRARFARFLKRAGVKHHSFHTLRHTFATNCIEQGMNVKALSEILGHSDVSITLERYVHTSMELKKEQINMLKTFANR